MGDRRTIETLTAYRARRPDDAAFAYRTRRFPRLCPLHRRPVLTTMGGALPMDITPTHRWMALHERYPFSLWVGEALVADDKHRVPVRLIFCPDCVEAVERLSRAPSVPSPWQADRG